MVYEARTITEVLSRELDRRIKSNSRYSLRAFARSLGLSAGALSEILRGKRSVSLKRLAGISASLGLNKAEQKHLLKLAQMQDWQFTSDTQSEPERGVVDADVFDLIGEWPHFAILNLLDCVDCKWDSRWIAKRLGISVLKAKLAMELLIRVGLVLSKAGKPTGRSLQVVTGGEAPSEAIRNYHHQILDKAKEALETQSVNEREFGGCGFAFDPKRLRDLKAEIVDFQDYLMEKYGGGNRTEVYFLEMALFKITQEDK